MGLFVLLLPAAAILFALAVKPDFHFRLYVAPLVAGDAEPSGFYLLGMRVVCACCGAALVAWFGYAMVVGFTDSEKYGAIAKNQMCEDFQAAAAWDDDGSLENLGAVRELARDLGVQVEVTDAGAIEVRDNGEAVLTVTERTGSVSCAYSIG